MPSTTTATLYGEGRIPQLTNSSPTWDYLINALYQCNNNETQMKKQFIHQYNYVPEKFILHSVSNEERLYLGVELEVDEGGKSEDNAEYVYNFMNVNTDNIYCCHDGSLSNGFEIITHPMTFEYHQSLPYEELFKQLTDKGYRSHDTRTCGMHVHINRDYFGKTKIEQDFCISKLLFLYEKYWDKVEIVARRKSNNYARRFRLEEDETPLDLYAKSKNADKYGAINLQHKDTIEIRIFKGTLNYNTFINTLEFVKKIAILSKVTDIYDIQLVTWNKIIDMFSKSLVDYIEDRESKQKEDDNKETSFTASFDMHNSAWDFTELINHMAGQGNGRFEDFTETFTFNYENASVLTEEERLQRQITDVKIKIRRARNGFEITNLNRQLGQLERELRRLRLSNRNNTEQ